MAGFWDCVTFLYSRKGGNIFGTWGDFVCACAKIRYTGRYIILRYIKRLLDSGQPGVAASVADRWARP